MDKGFTDPSKAINILQNYQMNCRTACDQLNAHLNVSDYPKFKELIANIAEISEELVKISEEEINQYSDLRFLNHKDNAIPVYAKKIQQKIESLEEAYREQQFYKWLDSGKIVCRENYAFPSVITPADTIDSIPYSLYEEEKNDMNNFEARVLDYIVSLNNVEWWHRIIDRKGFRINGFTNHYPDFIIKTKSGKIVMVETKGDDRDNSDSKKKLKLGRHWASQSGGNYRYFMVFDNIELEQAYTVDGFMEIMKEL